MIFCDRQARVLKTHKRECRQSIFATESPKFIYKNALCFNLKLNVPITANILEKPFTTMYNNKKEMLAFARVVAWNKLIKREIIEENNIRFPKGLRYEDIEFTYKLIPHLNKICYVDQCFIHYIQRKNSIANVQNEKTAEIFP